MGLAVDNGFFSAYNKDKNTVLATHARVAETFLSRFRGLMFRAQLEEGEGLLIKHKKNKRFLSIHTLFMRFPIDVVFLDEESIVVDVVTGLEPWKLWKRSAKPAAMVLEVPVGVVSYTETTPGDKIIFLPTTFDTLLSMRVNTRKDVTNTLANALKKSVLEHNLKVEIYYNPSTGGIHIGGPDKFFTVETLREYFGDAITIGEGRSKYLRDEQTLVVGVRNTLAVISKLGGRIPGEKYVVLTQEFGGEGKTTQEKRKDQEKNSVKARSVASKEI